MLVSGGKSVYGASVGILMLEQNFPRIPGDIGNALTWPFPVRYKVVRGATAAFAVTGNEQDCLPLFIEAGRELLNDGVEGIVTSCGFLSLYQQELTSALGVPVATSALMQVPYVNKLLPQGQRVGIITLSEQSLTSKHLLAAGIDFDVPVVGTDNGQEFSRVFLNDEPMLDVSKARDDLIDAATRLTVQYPEVGAIVLECTNMVPYANAIHSATGLPVYCVYSLILWFQAGLCPRVFSL